MHTTFKALLNHDYELVVRYSSGALKNMAATLQTHAILDSHAAERAVSNRTLEADVEEFQFRRAARIVVKYINNIKPDVRLRRLLHAKQRQEKEPALPVRTPRRNRSAAAVARCNAIASGSTCSSNAASVRGAGSRAPSSCGSIRRDASASDSPDATPRGGVAPSVSLARAALPHSPSAVGGDKVASDASSSHSGSTTYCSVASSAGRDKEKDGRGAAPAQPTSAACFEV